MTDQHLREYFRSYLDKVGFKWMLTQITPK